MTEYAVAVLVDGVADLSVLHEPATVFAEPPLQTRTHCGATGYVYLRAGLPSSAAECVDCARVRSGECQVGSVGRYAHGCRCNACRQAATEYRREYRANANQACVDCGGHVSRPGSQRCWTCYLARKRSRPLPEHGTNARYSRGCRCEPCAQVHREYMAEWRQKTMKEVAA